jgi:outer membrane protein TolC
MRSAGLPGPAAQVFRLLAVLLFLGAALVVPAPGAWAENQTGTGTGTIRLTLDEAVALGLRNSSDIRMKTLEVAASLADVQAAKAARYADLSLSASYQHLSEQPQMAGFYAAAQDSASVSVAAQQPLYTFGQISTGIDLADTGYTRAQVELGRERQSLVMDIKRAFYGYLLARESLRVQEETQRSKQEALEIARKRHQAGLGTELDVLRAESDLKNFASQVLSARNQVELAVLTVMDLLELDQSEEAYREGNFQLVLVGELEPRSPRLDAGELMERAVQDNFAIREYRTGISAALHEERLNRRRRLPTIAGFANYALESGYDPVTGESDFSGSGWSDLLTVGVSVQVPLSSLFPWSGPSAAVKKSQLTVQSLNQGLESLKGGVRMGMRSALLRLAEERAKIESGEAQVKLAERVLDTSRESYRNGLITSLELQDAQLGLNAARLGRLQAVFNYQMALFDLYNLLGVTELE